MNRAQRRAAMKRADLPLQSGEFVPVFGPDDRAIALVPTREVKLYETAPNARVVRRRHDGQVVRIQLKSLADDREYVVHRGNPRRYSHDHETDANPPRVWTMRKLGSKDPEGEAFIQRVFRSSVLDLQWGRESFDSRKAVPALASSLQGKKQHDQMKEAA